MSPKLILPIGCAASGKTSWFTRFISPNVSFRISADEIRFEILNYPKSGIDFDPMIEPQVWAKVWQLFIANTLVRNPIFLDCTNLTQARRMPFINCARAFGYEIQIVWFKKSLMTCLQQNAARDRTLDESIIARQFVALQAPEGYEYDTLIKVA